MKQPSGVLLLVPVFLAVTIVTAAAPSQTTASFWVLTQSEESYKFYQFSVHTGTLLSQVNITAPSPPVILDTCSTLVDSEWIYCAPFPWTSTYVVDVAAASVAPLTTTTPAGVSFAVDTERDLLFVHSVSGVSVLNASHPQQSVQTLAVGKGGASTYDLAVHPPTSVLWVGSALLAAGMARVNYSSGELLSSVSIGDQVHPWRSAAALSDSVLLYTNGSWGLGVSLWSVDANTNSSKLISSYPTSYSPSDRETRIGSSTRQLKNIIGYVPRANASIPGNSYTQADRICYKRILADHHEANICFESS